jgi:hypothetical protein
MPVPRRVAKSRISSADISDFEWGLLTDELDPDQAGDLDQFLATCNMEPGSAPPGGRPTIGDLWRVHGEAIVAAWAEHHPGTRPSCWWRWTAPRQPPGAFPGWYFDGKLPEPRQRLGGIGIPQHEVLAVTPSFAFGIPTGWVHPRDAGGFAGAVDLADPPRFESQASYLRRLDLLLPGEGARLGPPDFLAEVVVPKAHSTV